jgi:hypothetical protein
MIAALLALTAVSRGDFDLANHFGGAIRGLGNGRGQAGQDGPSGGGLGIHRVTLAMVAAFRRSQ